MINENDFSVEDLHDFGVFYYRTLGVKSFRETFVVPLGNETITQIAQQVSFKSPLFESNVQISHKKRINFLNKMFSFTIDNSDTIEENQVPIINYSDPVVRFIDLKFKINPTYQEQKVIKICVESYIAIFGYDKYLEEINSKLIYQIFKISTQRFSELFIEYKKKVNYISYTGNETQQIKNQIISQFQAMEKDKNSPFIVIVSRIGEVNYEWIEMECNYIIYQIKFIFKILREILHFLSPMMSKNL
ncbi:MAG: hypothetical protein ACLFPL_04870 [Candidatus Nanoarchaeia archaeon]